MLQLWNEYSGGKIALETVRQPLASGGPPRAACISSPRSCSPHSGRVRPACTPSIRAAESPGAQRLTPRTRRGGRPRARQRRRVSQPDALQTIDRVFGTHRPRSGQKTHGLRRLTAMSRKHRMEGRNLRDAASPAPLTGGRTMLPKVGARCREGPALVVALAGGPLGAGPSIGGPL